jgi:hypothetical protein
MQIDATVILVLPIVEIHIASFFCLGLSWDNSLYPLRLQEATSTKNLNWLQGHNYYQCHSGGRSYLAPVTTLLAKRK